MGANSYKCKIALFGVKSPFSSHNEASMRVSMMVDQFGVSEF
jgi:hypothetical protein